MSPLRRRSVNELPPAGKLAAYLILVGWAVVVLFPLYWLVITSFKLPVQVNSGPVYLPFVDFQPSLDAWRYIFVDLRDDTLRPYVNTVVVALSSDVASATATAPSAARRTTGRVTRAAPRIRAGARARLASRYRPVLASSPSSVAYVPGRSG